jgi:hypothetical protein
LKTKNSTRTQHAYCCVGRLLIKHLLRCGVWRVTVSPNCTGVAPRTRQVTQHAIERAVTLLGGEIAVERGIPTHPIGAKTKHRREVSRLLAMFTRDPNAGAKQLEWFEDQVARAVLANWLAVDSVAHALLGEPDRNAADLDTLLEDWLVRVAVARAYSMAATAISRHRFGDEIESVSLARDNHWTGAGVTVVPTMRSPQQRMVESLLAVRRRWITTKSAHVALTPLLPRMNEIVRLYNYERVADREVISLLVRAERILDNFAGAIDAWVSTAISEAVVAQAVPVLAGDQCGGRGAPRHGYRERG